MFGIGFQELILIAALALVLIGPEKLPEMMKSLGKGTREFKRAMEELKTGFGDATAESMETPGASVPSHPPQSYAPVPSPEPPASYPNAPLGIASSLATAGALRRVRRAAAPAAEMPKDNGDEE